MPQPQRVGRVIDLTPTLFCISAETILRIVQTREPFGKKRLTRMEKVWHYTTLNSFQAMLNNSIERGKEGKPKLSKFIFWASNVIAMNDPTEYKYGYELFIKNLLPQIEKELKIKDGLKLSQIWNNHWETKENPEKWHDVMIQNNSEMQQSAFVISFSKQKDFLPMWNVYASMGNGISLGFNNYEWRFKSNSEVEVLSRLHTSDVTYGEYGELPNKVISELYQKYYQEVSKIRDSQKRFNYMVQQLSAFSVIATSYIKHKAYQYENESRLIKFKNDDKDVKYRCNDKGHIIPYIEVPVEKEFLLEIVIGPCADFESTQCLLKSELLPLGIDVEISKSDVPYRIY